MSEELIRETNELMKRLLELREKDDAEREAQKANAEMALKEFNDKHDLNFKVSDMSEFEQRQKDNMADIKKRAEEANSREAEYRNELLGELKKQNELLEKIAEALTR